MQQTYRNINIYSFLLVSPHFIQLNKLKVLGDVKPTKWSVIAAQPPNRTASACRIIYFDRVKPDEDKRGQIILLKPYEVKYCTVLYYHFQ